MSFPTSYRSSDRTQNKQQHLILVSTIFLGPFLNPSSAGVKVGDLQPTGFSIEFAGDKVHGCIPVFKVDEKNLGLNDYYVDSERIGFEVPFIANHCIDTPTQRFVALEDVVAALYRQHHPKRPLLSFLEEWSESLPFEGGFGSRIVGGADLVSEQLKAEGFEVYHAFTYGRMLLVRFAWVPGKYRDQPFVQRFIHAAAAEFNPKPDRTLGVGRWVMPLETTINFRLAKTLRGLVGKPISALSVKDQQWALNSFNWTKMTMMSARELRAARIQFIFDHTELHGKPRELAQAMINAELYTDITELNVIVEQISKVLGARR